MTVYAIQLNDSIIAVADDKIRARAMAEAVKDREGLQHRHVYVRPFALNEWPELWAGPDPTQKKDTP